MTIWLAILLDCFSDKALKVYMIYFLACGLQMFNVVSLNFNDNGEIE